MEQVAVREQIREPSKELSDPFVHVTFEGGTHQSLGEIHPGRGRKGKLTEKGRSELKVVKRAGGQCERCRILKKKVRDDS